MDSLADTLRAFRADLGLSQSKAAALLDVPVRTYQEWEHGRSPAAPEKIMRAALIEIARKHKTKPELSKGRMRKSA